MATVAEAPDSGREIAIVRLCEHPESLDTIVEWIDAEWGAFSGRSRAQTHARFAAETRLHLPQTYVALRGGVTVGVGSLRERDSTNWDPGATPWICNVYVATAARGGGIAERLCMRMERRAEELGHAVVYLASMMASGSVYERIGYIVYRRVHVANGNMHLMRRALDSRRGGEPVQ